MEFKVGDLVRTSRDYITTTLDADVIYRVQDTSSNDIIFIETEDGFLIGGYFTYRFELVTCVNKNRCIILDV